MYRIKPKKGYNLIIDDLKLHLSSERKGWKYLTDEEFNNSRSIKSLIDDIIYEKVKEFGEEETKKTKKETKKNDIVNVGNGMFVPNKNLDSIPTGFENSIINEEENNKGVETDIIDTKTAFIISNDNTDEVSNAMNALNNTEVINLDKEKAEVKEEVATKETAEEKVMKESKTKKSKTTKK